MACHEVAALRLGLMNILGQNDEAERAHELAELGDAATKPGPLKALSDARDLATALKLYESTLSDLGAKVAGLDPSNPKLPYYRTLMVFTKKVELELRAQVEGLARLSRELDEMHDFVHEIYPAD